MSEAIGILHERFCCSPSGCLPFRVAVNSQGAAIGENLLRHSVPSSIAELFSGGQGVQGSGRNFLLQYSFCCSPSGCLPSRVAVNSQGAAIGENLLRHFVPSSVAELFSGRQSLQDSGRYFLLQYSFCCSPSGCLPSRVAVNSQGAAVGENMFQHFVLSSVAELFSGGQGLQGLGRYSLLRYSFCCSPSGCLLSREAVDSQSAAIGENLLRHSVPSSIVELFSGEQGLQGLGRYSLLRYSLCCSPSGCLPSRLAVNSQGTAIGENLLRHFVLSSVAELFSGRQSLKGSDRYFLRQSRRIVPAAIPSMSLKGSDRYSLRHSRRLAPTDTPSMSLKGSYRYSPAA